MSSSEQLLGPMRRLEEVAADAGKVLTRHAFLKPDEAALILDEIQRLRANVRQLQQFMLLQDEGVLSKGYAESGSAPKGPPVIDF